MNLPSTNNRTKIFKFAIYFLLVIVGMLIVYLCSMVQHAPAPQAGEYFYSSFFRNNFTLLAHILFFVTGLLVGYFYQPNPWLAGACLNLVFPLISVVEGSVYPGSHNLIPVEFAFQLWFALPSVAAVYIGRFIFKQVTKRKDKIVIPMTN